MRTIPGKAGEAAETSVAAGMKAAGYTLLELTIALTLLSLGSAMLWYTLRSSTRMENLNRIHAEANLLARSEMEGLRRVARSDIRDTTYRVAISGEAELVLMREVFDSTRILSTLDEVALDENFAPAELRKPLEVRVRVFQAREADGSDASPETGRVLSSLVLKIPEYRWH